MMVFASFCTLLLCWFNCGSMKGICWTHEESAQTSWHACSFFFVSCHHGIFCSLHPNASIVSSFLSAVAFLCQIKFSACNVFTHDQNTFGVHSSTFLSHFFFLLLLLQFQLLLPNFSVGVWSADCVLVLWIESISTQKRIQHAPRKGIQN